MAGKPYNGHSSWNAWNVALWIGNDEPLYRAAQDAIAAARRRKSSAVPVWRRAANSLIYNCGLTRTPDGARYSLHSVALALKGLEE